MMQVAVCLSKFKYYPDVHDKQRDDLGALLGHCRAQPCQLIALCNCQLFESQRYMLLFVFHRIIEVLSLFYLL